MRIKQKALVFSIFVHHVWGSILIFSKNPLADEMFSAVCLGISSILLLLSGEKVIKAWGEVKWGKKEEDG